MSFSLPIFLGTCPLIGHCMPPLGSAGAAAWVRLLVVDCAFCAVPWLATTPPTSLPCSAHALQMPPYILWLSEQPLAILACDCPHPQCKALISWLRQQHYAFLCSLAHKNRDCLL